MRPTVENRSLQWLASESQSEVPFGSFLVGHELNAGRQQGTRRGRSSITLFENNLTSSYDLARGTSRAT